MRFGVRDLSRPDPAIDFRTGWDRLNDCPPWRVAAKLLPVFVRRPSRFITAITRNECEHAMPACACCWVVQWSPRSAPGDQPQLTIGDLNITGARLWHPPAVAAWRNGHEHVALGAVAQVEFATDFAFLVPGISGPPIDRQRALPMTFRQ